MLKVAMVGIGDIAQKAYLPLLSKMEGVEILLCSRNVNVVALIAKKYKICTTRLCKQKSYFQFIYRRFVVEK